MVVPFKLPFVLMEPHHRGFEPKWAIYGVMVVATTIQIVSSRAALANLPDQVTASQGRATSLASMCGNCQMFDRVSFDSPHLNSGRVPFAPASDQ